LSVKLLITNDDGYRSYGIRSLVGSLAKSYEVVVVAPDGPRSASGLALTFYRPLRVREFIFDGVPYYAVNGTPGDCVSIGLFHVFRDRPPKMVVSGINIGENISMLEFFMSGTVAAAIYAALHDIPSIAFSKRFESVDVLSPDSIEDGFGLASEVAKLVVDTFYMDGFPEGIDLISVNFPSKISSDTEMVVTKLAKRSINSRIYIRKDPRGRPYYWIWGDKRRRFRRGTDAHEVIVKGNISITPISLNFWSEAGYKSMVNIVKYLNEEFHTLIK